MNWAWLVVQALVLGSVLGGFVSLVAAVITEAAAGLEGER